MSQDDRTPAVKALRLQLPEGVPVEDALDALQAATISLEKSRKHEEGPVLSPNEASKRLLKYVEESYDIMAESLVREIKKVFDEGEAKSGR